MRGFFVFILSASFMCISVLAFAQEQEALISADQAEILTLRGEIIDNICAVTKDIQEIGSFIKTHSRDCALSPSHKENGYSIYSDGRLMVFDKDSNDKIELFLMQPDSKPQVVITARKSAGELSLVSIENQ